jgi:arginase
MSQRTVAIIGVPLDLGAGRRGVDMGPSAFRVAELNERIAELGYEVTDLGDLKVAIQETQASGDPRLKYLKEIKEVCETLRDRVYDARKKGQVPLVLGAPSRAWPNTITNAKRRSGSSGSTPTPTATPRIRAPRATSTVCPSRPPWAWARLPS